MGKSRPRHSLKGPGTIPWCLPLGRVEAPHDIEVIFVDEPDEIINPLGIKGVGEIGVVGTAAAIANAIYHATGKRVRDLPITPDKLI